MTTHRRIAAASFDPAGAARDRQCPRAGLATASVRMNWASISNSTVLLTFLALIASETSAQVAPALRSERAYVWLADTAAGRDLERDLRERSAVLRPTERYEVDLTPVLDNVLGYFSAVGIPLREDRALAGNHGIAFSAVFRVEETLPALRFHIGDCGPFDAFYADSGFRWALSWPLPMKRHLSLYLQGGEDNEFGNWAIAGLQWRHPRLPLAVGVGLPIALGNTGGGLGALVQIRMSLD